MASAGTVTLELDANSVKMIQNLQKAQKQTKRSAGAMKQHMVTAFKGIAVAAAAMSSAVLLATKKSIEFGDKIGKMANATGLSAEKFQEMAFAAQRAGINQSQFTSNMVAFVKRVGEARAGMGPLVSGLKNLDPVLLENIKNSKNQEEALGLVADAIKNAKTATERAAIANAAFSRAGVTMVNMLQDGQIGLDKMSQTAREYGIVLSNELIKKSEAVADKMGDLQKIMQVRIAETVLENAESIISLTESLIDFVGAIGKATKGWNDWMAAQGIAVNTLDDINIRGKKLTAERLALEERLQNTTNARVRQSLRSQINKIKAEQKLLQDLAVSIQKAEAGRVGPGAAPAEGVDTKGGGGLDAERTAEEASEVAKIIENLRSQLYANEEDRVLFKLLDAGATEAELEEALQAFEILEQRKADAEAQAEVLKQRNDMEREYQSLLESTRTTLEAHDDQLMRIYELYEAGIIPSAEKLDEIVARTQAQYDKQAEAGTKASEQLGSAATNAFASVVNGAQSAEDAVKSLLKQIAILIIKQAILRAIGGATGSVDTGSIFQGNFADGGFITGGQAAIVGERGPELIVPKSSGYVIPNHRLGGNVTVNVDAREADDPGKLLALIPVIQAQVEEAIGLKSRRGYR